MIAEGKPDQLVFRCHDLPGIVAADLEFLKVSEFNWDEIWKRYGVTETQIVPEGDSEFVDTSTPEGKARLREILES